MTEDSYIIIRRHLYEEPDCIQLEWIISNGLFSATTDIYTSPYEIEEMGKTLRSLFKDDFKYEYGSSDPLARCYRHFIMSVYRIDSIGHKAIQFKINQNENQPDEGESLFSIKTDVAAINRLGESIERFSKLEHLEMLWTSKESHLYETHSTNKHWIPTFVGMTEAK